MSGFLPQVLIAFAKHTGFYKLHLIDSLQVSSDTRQSLHRYFADQVNPQFKRPKLEFVLWALGLAGIVVAILGIVYMRATHALIAVGFALMPMPVCYILWKRASFSKKLSEVVAKSQSKFRKTLRVTLAYSQINRVGSDNVSIKFLSHLVLEAKNPEEPNESNPKPEAKAQKTTAQKSQANLSTTVGCQSLDPHRLKNQPYNPLNKHQNHFVEPNSQVQQIIEDRVDDSSSRSEHKLPTLREFLDKSFPELKKVEAD